MNEFEAYYNDGTVGLILFLNKQTDEKLTKMVKKYFSCRTKVIERDKAIDALTDEIKARASRGKEFGDFKLPD